MCGIVGFIGKNAVNKVVENLKNLEYRGYDSCGVAYFDNNEIKTKKSLNSIDSLKKDCSFLNDKEIAIGHTRWATHGKPALENAHPHLSFSKNWCAVHNGIIENFAELKNKFFKNTTFYSQTDSEIVPNLVEHFGNDINSVIKACNIMTGSFALALINKDNDKIFVAKRNSPLFVSVSNCEVMCASDSYCFEDKAKYFELKDNEFAEITKDNVVFYNKFFKKINKRSYVLNKTNYCLEKTKYPFHMIKEINEIPNCIESIYSFYKSNLPKIDIDIKDIERIKIIGCGSAYHTGLIGANYLEKLLKIETNVFVASEFRYSSPILNEKTLTIFVSQSGETADTIACVKQAKKFRCKTLGIVNAENSTIARLCESNIFMKCGREIAVATTKAFVNGVLAFFLLANYFENNLNCALKSLKKIKKNIETILNSYTPTKLIDILSKKDKCFFIGRNLDYFISMEGCLKLKEIAYINCSCFASGELKHGTLALIENDTYVFSVITDSRLKEKNISNIKEIQSRGGKVIILTNIDNLEVENCEIIHFKKVDKNLDILSAVIYFQLISYYTTTKKGLNPDKPRNLAKSVTVE